MRTLSGLGIAVLLFATLGQCVLSPIQTDALNALNANCGLNLRNASEYCTCELDICFWNGEGGDTFLCDDESLSVLENSKLWTCGTLPTELAVFNKLETLSLTLAISPEPSSGTMPTQWANMTSLKKLYLTYLSATSMTADRLISGTLPTQWSSMEHMKDFVMMNWGAVSGTLPSEWAAWPLADMGRFVLQSVGVTGTLPTELAPMVHGESFSSLIIRDTRISGTVPSQFADKSAALLFLNLPDNYLSGTIPQAFSADEWKYSMVDFVGNQWSCPLADPTLSDRWSAGFGQICSTCTVWASPDCPMRIPPVYSGDLPLESCFLPPGAEQYAGVACSWGSGLNKRDPTFTYYEGCSGPSALNLYGSVSQHCNTLNDCARNYTGLSGQCTNINSSHSILCLCGGGGGAAQAGREKYAYHFGMPLGGFVPILIFCMWLPLVVAVFYLTYVFPLVGFHCLPIAAWRPISHDILRFPGMLFHFAIWFAAFLTWSGLGALASAITGPAVSHDIHGAEIGSSIVVGVGVVSSLMLVAAERASRAVVGIPALVCGALVWVVVTIVPLATVIPGYRAAQQFDHYAYACQHRRTYQPDSEFSDISPKRCNDLHAGYSTYALGVSLLILSMLLQIVVALVLMILKATSAARQHSSHPPPALRSGYGTLPADEGNDNAERSLVENAATNEHL